MHTVTQHLSKALHDIKTVRKIPGLLMWESGNHRVFLRLKGPNYLVHLEIHSLSFTYEIAPTVLAHVSINGRYANWSWPFKVRCGKTSDIIYRAVLEVAGLCISLEAD